MFIINAPFLFTSVWYLVTPLMDEVTYKKITILGSNYKDELLKFIDIESLPEIYGGACKCVNGCTESDAGPWCDGSVPGYPKPEFEKVFSFRLIL
jgi:hypothetical protein